MSVLDSVRMMAAGAAWRFAGLDPAGRVLINAMERGDENAATLAGMLLVKSGDRSQRLVTKAIESGASSPQLVTVLESIASPNAEATLRRLAARETGPLRDEARRALSDLEEIRRRRD